MRVLPKILHLEVILLDNQTSSKPQTLMEPMGRSNHQKLYSKESKNWENQDEIAVLKVWRSQRDVEGISLEDFPLECQDPHPLPLMCQHMRPLFAILEPNLENQTDFSNS